MDKWLRMRIRSMKFKRKRTTDNWRLWRQHFRNLGFVFLSDACVPAVVEPTPRKGHLLWGRPVPERGPPVNRGN